MPGSGGSYRYLREIYGAQRLGRMLSFLYIWQLSFSAPLSIASGCVGLAQYAVSVAVVGAGMDGAGDGAAAAADWTGARRADGGTGHGGRHPLLRGGCRAAVSAHQGRWTTLQVARGRWWRERWHG